MARERISRRPYVWQTVPWSDGQILTRGSVDGLPALTWGRADREALATARQLRELGLRPAGADPVAVLVFGHRREGRRPVEYASLYRIDEAAPKRTATPAQREAIERALGARRTCQRCGQQQDYYLSTRSRMCGPCSEATGVWDDQAAAVDDDWRAEHDAAIRAEDPYRPITETDLAGPELDLVEPPEPDVGDADEADVVALPPQRSAEPRPAPTPDIDRAAIEDDSTPAADDAAQATQHTQRALTRIAQHRAADARAGDETRAERLARWHAHDHAAERPAHADAPELAAAGPRQEVAL
ncbi:MAG: hypothetical protein GEU83_18195 [Pseudonocardiaceae bacterium]|nr:hypothetical protein [Pseudonocardiaceae bacterium]